ncbi:hypothetical protein KGF56_003433 [Candida oxycetoniae]|uniref:C3H1-type domain-containing protein n=1 Tax=Candida oxycetoniae TaxID=497107 RepID=A0AAI9SVG0_9ASCO|nr:uncharacterized protein KGF56_003433 [Candida oxycetoniae]KAI3403798.2 hypothetical protein KGF56_003433 [Candida oxycetoniae]
MSHGPLLDSNEIKQMYKEIAVLKTSIHERKLVVKNFSNKIGKRVERQRHMRVVVEKDSNGIPQQFVTVYSRTGTSLVNMRLYKREAMRLTQEGTYTEADVENVGVKNAGVKCVGVKNADVEEAIMRQIKMRIFRNKRLNDHCDRVSINNVKYSVAQNGRFLLPLGYNGTNEQAVGEIVWNGEIYRRTKGGNYKIHGEKTPKIREGCRYFTRTGICSKGLKCKYLHEQSKVKICSFFLNNKCTMPNCLLSHTPNSHNTPLCRYNLVNKCHNSQCKYMHTVPEYYDDPRYEIWTCRPFALGSWCSRGKNCPFLHLLNCPDFEEDNVCPRGHECTLNHVFTLRTQKSISTRFNVYIREKKNEEEEGEEQEQEQEQEGMQGVQGVQKKEQEEKEVVSVPKIIINSYNVDPSMLFMYENTHGLNHFIDEKGTQANNEYEPAPSTQLLIEVSSDYSDDDE